MLDIWKLNNDIDRMCNCIKHDPDSVDPDVVRSLLRQSQSTFEILHAFVRPGFVKAEYDRERESYDITITTHVHHEDTETLLKALWPDITITRPGGDSH